MKKLLLTKVVNSKMPLPPELANLPIIEAEPWCQIKPDVFLEGPSFDLEGNLFITSPQNGLIFKITPRKKVSLVFNQPKIEVDGTAFHKDGRLFGACITGEILIFFPESGKFNCLFPKYKGQKLSMNDLVFDAIGNVYVTDFKGTVGSPTGGVYRISSDGQIVHCVLGNLASPNGVSLSPEGNMLWIGETGRNTILRITLEKDGITPNPIDGVSYACYLSGCPGPDSNKVDEDGNLYQCLIFQGRVIVVNRYGVPIANVIIPGRNEGLHLITPNMAFKPGTRDGYIIAGGKGGAWIYRFKGLTRGLELFSHRK
jgi:lactonase